MFKSKYAKYVFLGTGAYFGYRLLKPFKNTHYRDLTGKTAIVTGGSRGIGLETVKGLIDMNATVIVLGRSPINVDEIMQTSSGSGKCSFQQIDLNDLENVKEVANKLLGELDSVDILVNNAGLFEKTLNVTKQGIESTMCVNVISPMYLIHKLLPLLSKSNEARVINVSSRAKSSAVPDFNSPFSLPINKEAYNGYRVYSTSKLYMTLLTSNLSKKVPSNISLISLHPGVIRTALLDSLLDSLMWPLNKILKANPFLLNNQQGAQGTLWACARPVTEADRHSNGAYWINGRIEYIKPLNGEDEALSIALKDTLVDAIGEDGLNL